MNKEILSSFVGKTVKVNRGGPDSRIGNLLEVGEDFFVLLTKEDGVLYYKSHHVKSLTDNAKKGFELELDVPKDFMYKKGDSFKEVLGNLIHKWVTIHLGGPEKCEGILDRINDEYMTVVFDEEVISIAMFHVRTLSYGLKVKNLEKKDDGKSSKDDGKDDKKDSGKSSKNDGDTNKKDDEKSSKDGDEKK